MKPFWFAILFLIAAAWADGAAAQMPVPHELLWRKRSGFHIPRTRAWDHDNYQYFGGGPEIEDECGGAGHCWHRPAVWRCHEHLIWPEPARWTFQADYIRLKRESENRQDFLFDDVTGTPLFGMQDFNFHWQPSYRLAGRLNLTDVAAVEAVFLRVHQGWHERRVVDSLAPIRVDLFSLSAVSPFDPFLLVYETQMQTGELNFRRSVEHGAITFITGFRWVEIDELFSASVPLIATDVRVQTQNKLLGWQAGLEGQHWVNYGILRIDSSIKGGVYQNTTHNRARIETGGVGLVDVGAADKVPAWLGEARVTLNAPITKNCYLRGGYQLIHLTGLSLAANQIKAIDATVPAVGLDSKGQAIYHGWFLGLEAWW